MSITVPDLALEVLTVGSIPFNIDLSCWENDFYFWPHRIPQVHLIILLPQPRNQPFLLLVEMVFRNQDIQVLGVLTAAGVLLFRDLLSR